MLKSRIVSFVGNWFKPWTKKNIHFVERKNGVRKWKLVIAISRNCTSLDYGIGTICHRYSKWKESHATEKGMVYISGDVNAHQLRVFKVFTFSVWFEKIMHRE